MKVKMVAAMVAAAVLMVPASADARYLRLSEAQLRSAVVGKQLTAQTPRRDSSSVGKCAHLRTGGKADPHRVNCDVELRYRDHGVPVVCTYVNRVRVAGSRTSWSTAYRGCRRDG